MSRLFRKLVAAAFLAASSGVGTTVAHAQPTPPNFGDDKSRWARDGECDDPRFEGVGMSDGLSLDDDIGHDATDCRTAWRVGDITLATRDANAPDFGDDVSDWAKDGECDDPRFEGPAMTDTKLLDADIGHDATDCRAAWDDGRLQLIGDWEGDTPDFGDNASDWANDTECDDPRFTGKGMTGTQLNQEDIRHDAADCQAAFEAGTIKLR